MFPRGGGGWRGSGAGCGARYKLLGSQELPLCAFGGLALTQNIPRHQSDGHAVLWHNRRPSFWWMGVLLALPSLPFHPSPSQPPPHRNLPVAKVLYLLGVAMATPAASPRVLLPAARQDQGPAVSPAGLPAPQGERPGPARLFGAPPPSVGGCRKRGRPSAPRQRSVLPTALLPTALPPPRSTRRTERSGAGGLTTQIPAGRELQPPPAWGTAGAPARSEVGGQGDGGGAPGLEMGWVTAPRPL